MFDPNEEQEIPLKHLLTCLSIPHMVSSPSQEQLSNMLSQCMRLDRSFTGKLTREDFDRVVIWFEPDATLQKQHKVDENVYQKLKETKHLLFDIFASQEVPLRTAD